MRIFDEVFLRTDEEDMHDYGCFLQPLFLFFFTAVIYMASTGWYKQSWQLIGDVLHLRQIYLNHLQSVSAPRDALKDVSVECHKGWTICLILLIRSLQ